MCLGATKPTLLELVVHNKRSRGNGSMHIATESSPYLLQLEKARSSKDPAQQKKLKKK